MKKLLLLGLVSFSLTAEAQFTVAPFGSTNSGSPPPIGVGRKSNGAFEVVIKPFCYGTNLRAYPVTIQMNPAQNVTADIVFTDPDSPSKKDTFTVSFSPRLTYASSGSRTDCYFEKEEDMSKPGDHLMACYVPWNDKTYRYKLSEWKARTNPQNKYSNVYNNYMGIGLPATLVDESESSEIDKDLTCLYKFTQYWRDGQMITSAVSCYFPSRLPDLSHLVTVKKDGATFTGEIEAYTNSIRLTLKEPLKSMASSSVVRHGQITVERPPRHSTSFHQPGSAAPMAFYNPWSFFGLQKPTPPPPPPRYIAAIREKESFDEANAFQTFTTQVKFPGMEGFCGGYYSPLMLFFDEKLPAFRGVSLFPLFGVKKDTPVHWVEPGAPGYFLVNLQGKKKVESHSQLFGQNEKFENGFEALRVHDDNKDNVIDSKDRIFADLVLWNDKNGDGHSSADELKALQDMNVTSISLKYTSKDQTNFENRARIREKGQFTFMKSNKEMTAKLYDVWLSPFELD
jgi:hypothetical protein